MLIVRVMYADRDKSSDTEIEKSGLYKIDEDTVTLAHAPSLRLKFLTHADNLLEFTVVRLPVGVLPDKIASLGDVENFGGATIGTAAMVVAGATPVAALPSSPNQLAHGAP